MSAIVTCNEVGNSLTHWLKLASDIEKKALLNELLSELKSCSEESLDADQYLATCEDLDEAIKKATEKIKADVNKGLDLPKDATDCSRPVTICGVNNLLNDANNNDIKEAVANVIKSKATDDAEFRQVFVNTLISKAAGNRIEMRKDGIGVWDAAPPNLANQYVDAINGDDDNAGTRDKPLKTIRRAFDRIAQNGGVGEYYIRLKASQRHEINTALVGTPNATIHFRVYDHQYEKNNCGGFYPQHAENFPRPTVVFGLRETPYGTRNPVIEVERLTAYGIIFEKTPGGTDMFVPTESIFIINGGARNEFQGCDFHLSDGVCIIAPFVRFDLCRLYLNSPAKLVRATFFDTHVRIDDNKDGSRVIRCFSDNNLTYSPRVTNMRGEVTLDNIGIHSDASTKRLFGGSTSWDIFAGTGGSTTPTTPVTPSKQDIADAVKQALSELISSEAGNALRVDSNGKLFVPTPSNNNGSTGGSTTPSRPTEGRGSHFTSRIEVQTGTSGGDAAHGWKRTTNTVTVNLRNLEPNAEYFIKLNTSLFKFRANTEGNYSVTGSSSQTVKDSSFVNPTVSGSAADTTAAHNAFAAAQAGRVGGEHVQNYSAAAQFTLFKADGTELMIVPKTLLT